MRPVFVLVPRSPAPDAAPLYGPCSPLPPLPQPTLGFLPLLAWLISVSACSGAVSMRERSAGLCVIWRTLWHPCPPFWIPRPVICTGMLGTDAASPDPLAGSHYITVIPLYITIGRICHISIFIDICIAGAGAKRGTLMAYPLVLRLALQYNAC